MGFYPGGFSPRAALLYLELYYNFLQKNVYKSSKEMSKKNQASKTKKSD